jgi:hypothetical protein
MVMVSKYAAASDAMVKTPPRKLLPPHRCASTGRPRGLTGWTERGPALRRSRDPTH